MSYQVQMRRRGGIEPLHVSMPRELKSRPSTSPTHHGSRGKKEESSAFHICFQGRVRLVLVSRENARRLLACSAAYLFADGVAVEYTIVKQSRRLTACWEVVA